MVNILLNPDGFFVKKLEEKVNLKVPFLIVLIKGTFAVASSVLIMKKITESLPSDLNSFVAISALIGLIGGLIISFLGWLILSGILYLLSCHFDSEGSFKRTVEFVGYGYIPMILSSFVALLTMYIILPSIDISLQSPQLLQQSIEQITLNNPYIRFSQIIGILCILWSANFWVFALSHARNMSIKNSIFTVSIPIGLYLLYTIYILLGA